MDVFRSLERSPIVLSFKVLDRRTWRTGSYLRLCVLLRDGSELYTREYVSATERKYAFHWQDAAGTIIARWDNAPHYRDLKTHPDHLHTPDQVVASYEIDLADVLSAIEKHQ